MKGTPCTIYKIEFNFIHKLRLTSVNTIQELEFNFIKCTTDSTCFYGAYLGGVLEIRIKIQ